MYNEKQKKKRLCKILLPAHFKHGLRYVHGMNIGTGYERNNKKYI